MKRSNNAVPRAARTRSVRPWWVMILCTLALTACGGSSTQGGGAPVVGACAPGDMDTGACGTLLLGLTDADGDFLSYTVDVVSLELERADGALVEALPQSARLDFAGYVDLTEFVTASTLPPGTYVAGTLVLDYSAADVFVEADGGAKQATVVDPKGNALQRAEVRIVLAERDRLVITRGLTSFLTVDFDLAASHAVDTAPTPALAAAEPFIVAEIGVVDSKEIRVRGALIGVDVDAMRYTIEVRPFFERGGNFGRFEVRVAGDTELEVDGEAWLGAEGLRALEAAGAGTLTVAQGTLDASTREFTAALVLAGSSVPGSDRDAVAGNVIARDGNELVVRGATIMPRDAAAFFHDDVLVLVGPETRVFKTGDPAVPLTVDAISIGQRVLVRGAASDLSSERVTVDATAGAVRMSLTHLSGLAKALNPGQVDIELHAIDRRRAGAFDFSGTGISPAFDADPDHYEVATGDLSLVGQAVGQPVAIYGFPWAFGGAPADFEGRTLIDFSDVRSMLGVGWGVAGTHAPFVSMGGDGLLLDNANPDLGERHYIKQGPVLIDLTALPSGTLIIPRDTGRKAFMIATRDGLQLYADFAAFVEALALELDGATTARSLHARGQYDAASNVFSAYRIGVYLLEP